MKPNRITQHLTKNHRPPSLLDAGVTSLVICASSVFMGSMLYPFLEFRLSLLAGWALIVINPLALAVQSPLLVSKTVGDERHQLLKLTSLSPGEIRRGFVWMALFQVRVQLAVQVGLMMAWGMGLFNLWYRISYWNLYNPNSHRAHEIIILLIGIGWFGLNLLAVIFGVRQSLRSDSLARNIVVSSVLVLLLPVFCFIPAMRLIGPTLKAMELDLLTTRAMIGLIFVLFILLPYGLAATLYWWPNKPK